MFYALKNTELFSFFVFKMFLKGKKRGTLKKKSAPSSDLN